MTERRDTKKRPIYRDKGYPVFGEAHRATGHPETIDMQGKT
jgi:hypothetical protein